MVMVRRIGILLILLAFLTPSTVLSNSGDGDIPEIHPSAYTGSDGPENQLGELDGPAEGLEWMEIWDLIVEALAALP